KSKIASKGFPKTRHPRFSRKIGDGLPGSRDDRPSSPPTAVETSSGELHPNDRGALHLATSESWRGPNGSTLGPSPAEGVSHLNYYWGEEEEIQRGIPSEKVNVNILDQFGNHSDIHTPSVKPRKKGLQTLPGAPQMNSQISRYTVNPTGSRSTVQPAQDTNNPHDDDNDEVISEKLDPEADAEEDVYSSGGEEICVISRRVGFTEDVEDNEEKSNQKLIRRDTPHYNKRARIQSKTADGGDEEAVLKILEKYRASVSPSTGACDAAAPQPDSHLKLVRASLHNSSSNANRSQLFTSTPITDVGGTSARAQHEVVVHIHRQPGSGLGLSIAGGVGSIPYLGSDQGIFVSRLNPSGLAFSSGLRLNDKLIEVNGISLVKVEHHVAVSALRANTDHFRIVAIRDAGLEDDMPSSNAKFSNPPLPMPPNPNLPTAASLQSPLSNSLKKPLNSSENTLVRCTINRESSGLGFSIAGGRGTLPIPFEHETITISKITENGAASKCGQLQVGDQLLKINGIDVRDARHDQVIALLTGSGPRIELEVLRSPIDTNKVTATSNPPNGYRMPVGTTVPKPGSASMSYSGGFPSPRTKESWLGANHACFDTSGGVLDNNKLISGQPVRLRIEQGYPVDQVTIRLNGGPLGLAIYGGSDINCLPFSGDEPGIFISKISTDGAAQNTGLRVGDRILRVNDIDLRHATHDEAVRALIQTTKELKLEVRRDPTPSGLRRITISRRVGERFGFRIAGGVPPTKGDAPLSNPLSRLSNDGSIIVTWISPDGAVGRDGRLKPGDRLLEVNGNWMMGNSLEEALEIFRRIGPSLCLVVCDGPLDLTLQSQCTVNTPNDAVPCPSNPSGQTMCDLGGPMAGSAVDHADDLGDDLHANIVYSDAKRHFRTPVASSVYQVLVYRFWSPCYFPTFFSGCDFIGFS
ncbi:protein scribble, partial [Paragonimus westermani]